MQAMELGLSDCGSLAWIALQYQKSSKTRDKPHVSPTHRQMAVPLYSATREVLTVVLNGLSWALFVFFWGCARSWFQHVGSRVVAGELSWGTWDLVP